MPLESIVLFTDRDLGMRFPEILVAAGLNVRRHRDHFAPDCPDEIWLEGVSRQGWVAVSHDARIRYKPNELASVMRHRARLLVVIGKAPFPVLARNFVATALRIARFVDEHPAPWIAKIYRPSTTSLAENPSAIGSISLWYP